jgi:hypothetical protein
MNRSSRHSVFLLVLALLLLLGCGDNERNPRLLDSAEKRPDSSELDSERQRLQSLQLVRYVDSQGNEYFMPASALANNILAGYCGDFHDQCPEVGQSSCAGLACIERSKLCTIRFLQSAALIRAEPLTLPSAVRLRDDPLNDDLEDLSNYEEFLEEVKVPPQSAGARVAILRLALDRNKQVLNSLTPPHEICRDPNANENGTAELPWHEGVRASGLWAEVTVEAFDLLQEISEDAVDAILAAADAQRSVSPTTAQGAARSIAGAELSRAEAAHLLVGGSPGLLGSTTTAFCSSPELSGMAQAALRVLRRTAPDPDDITNEEVDIGTLLNAEAATFSPGSVRARLAALEGRTIIARLEDDVGLSREDFVQARSYLAQELRTFARDGSVTFVPEARGPIPQTMLFYAATGREPVAPPPEYFAALARHWFFEGPSYAPAGSGANHLEATDVSATLSNALGRVRETIGITSGSLFLGEVDDSTGETQRQFQGPLNLLAARDGRVGQLGWSRGSLPFTTFVADGYTGAHNLRVVRGLSGLLCATTGRVEGQPCSATTLASFHTVVTLTQTKPIGESGDAVVGVGYTSQAYNNVELDWEDATPLFLVKPRNPAQQVPGGYEVLGGFSMRGLPIPGAYRFALFPELDKKAGQILRPSEKWCTRSAVECDGTLFDERLPLENELSEDFDDVESSWRHYLTLAEQASAEAHLLGEEYLQNGLEIDRQLESTQIREVQDRQRYLDRVEGEMETIQDICGTAMDTTEIQGVLGLFGGEIGPTNGTFCSEPDGDEAPSCCGAVVTQNECPYTCQGGFCNASACGSGGSDSGCPSPYQCVARRCVLSPFILIQDEQSRSEGLSRLNECIGDGTVLEYVALGSEPLCLWDGGEANPTTICAGASQQYPCPVGARRLPNGEYDCNVLLPPGQTAKLVGARLGLADASSLIANQDPCHLFRLYRNSVPICATMGAAGCGGGAPPAVYDYLTRAFTPEFLGPQHMLGAEAIGWRADVVEPSGTGNASSILVDGRPRWSTAAGSPQWPCAAYRPIDASNPPIECPVASSLFCSTLTPGCPQNDEPQRNAASRMNQRMFEAVMVLKGLGAGDFDKIEVPLQLSHELVGNLGAPLVTRNTGRHFVQEFGGRTWRIYDDPATPDPLPPFWRFFHESNMTVSVFGVPDQAGPLLLRQPLPGGPRQPAMAEPALLGSIVMAQGSRPFSAWLESFNAQRPLPAGTPAAARGSIDHPYLVPRVAYTEQNVRDAVELLCEVTRGDTWHFHPVACPPANLGALIANGNFEALKEYAACRATAFNRTVSSMVLARVPLRAAEGVGSFSVSGGFPVVGGQMGTQMLRLRAAFTRYGEFAKTMADHSRQFGEIVDQMNLSLQTIQLRSAADQLAIDNAELGGAEARLQGMQASIKMSQIEYQQQSAWVKAGADCTEALGNAIGSIVQTEGASLFGGAAACGAAFVQADIEVQTLSYEHRIAQLDGQIADIRGDIADNSVLIQQNQLIINQIDQARDMIDLRGQLLTSLRAMDGLSTEAKAALDEIRASLAEIEILRLRVQRSLQRAVQFETTQAAVTENIESVLNSKLNVSKKRYLQAHKNAVRLSFLAKRAIEQRLGMHLSELRADMPLVEAPSSWEAEICAAEGIDYEAIRAKAAESGSTPAVPVDFSGAFIGDYVTKLKNVVESYRLQYDFHEGTDEAVASLRDDVLNVRAPCSEFSGNLLKHSGDLDHLVAASGEGGWQIEGCETTEEEGSPGTCLAFERVIEERVPGAPGFALTWGDDSTPDTRLIQSVVLKPGRYRVSWFSTFDPAIDDVPEVDVTLFHPEGEAFDPVSFTAPMTQPKDLWTRPGTLELWPRHYRFFDVPHEQEVWVAIHPGSSMPASDVRSAGGIMLEMVSDIERQVDPQLLSPPPFVATTDSLDTVVHDCQDTTGEVFRQSAWEYRCTKLCTDGFSDNCLDSSLADRCFWETTFALDQRELEAGRIFAQSGFARGNFNYRIEDVAINFVGTELRDCTDSSLPNTCNAAGFVTYSLKHLGPLFVRNHTGGDFPVKLFNGNIEHARGLGIERYLTNPISSTDRELLTPYMRAEFNGRPLDGNFVLRVWDEGVSFSAIQDVQLYLKYRYWTRFD